MGFIKYFEKLNKDPRKRMNAYLIRKNQLEIYNADSIELSRVRQDIRPVRGTVMFNDFFIKLGSLFSRADRYPTNNE